MRDELSRSCVAATPRAFAIGDGLMASPLYSLRNETTSLVSYQPASVTTWLRTLLPGFVLEDADIVGRAGLNTTKLAAEIDTIIAAHAGYDLALISVGLVDCEETTRGVAPEPAACVSALERIVGSLLRAGIRPAMLLPPPHPLFANGLFADRFICVSATLRRLARQFPDLVLIDPTDAMKRRDGFGIDPRPEMADAAQEGRPTVVGAFVLAELIADALLAAFPTRLLDQPPDLDGISLLAMTPDGSSGDTLSGFTLDNAYGGGIGADVATISGQNLRLRIHAAGAYTSPWPFLRLQGALPASLLKDFVPGRSIAAAAEIRIEGPSRGLASVSLQLTPVWETGYVGLSSCEFHGHPQIGAGRQRLLRTPRFVPPGPLKALSTSLMLHFIPGTERMADATVDVMSICLDGVSPPLP